MRRDELEFERPSSRQATEPPEARGLARDEVRLLVSTGERHEHARFRDLPAFLPPGTLLVVNRSATLPAGLPAIGRIGEFRVNLSTRYGEGVWLVEPRRGPAEPGPLPLAAGEILDVAGRTARLLAPYPGLPRLWFVRFEGDLERTLAERGEPIRYGHLVPPYPPLSAYQTNFAEVAGSAEMPSASRPFSLRLLARLREAGVVLASVLLHSGVSSHEVETDRVEDQPLFPEPFRVPPATAAAVNAAKREGRAVIAVGTTVVRALESAWDGEGLRPAAGFTRRFVRPGSPPRAVDGLITGLHDPLASHLALLHALVEPDQVRGAYREAVREGYLWHEFGDSHLILPAPLAARSHRPSTRENREMRSLQEKTVVAAGGTGNVGAFIVTGSRADRGALTPTDQLPSPTLPFRARW